MTATQAQPVEVITDAARGALMAQELLATLSRGKDETGALLLRMRYAIAQRPAFADAFAREIEKRLQVAAHPLDA